MRRSEVDVRGWWWVCLCVGCWGSSESELTIAVRDGHLWVGKDDRGAWDPKLGRGLKGEVERLASGRPVVVELAATTSLQDAIILVRAANESGIEAVSLRVTGGKTYDGVRVAKYQMPGRNLLKERIKGVGPLLSLVVGRSTSGADYVLGKVGFYALRNSDPEVEVPPGVRPTYVRLLRTAQADPEVPVECEAMLYPSDPALAAICAAGTSPRSIPLGGWTAGSGAGCMAPPTGGEITLAQWPEAISQALGELGTTPTDNIIVLGPKDTTLAPVLAVFDGFVAAGQPLPGLSPVTIPKRRDPPACDATIRSRRALEEEAAAWVGGLVARAAEGGPAGPSTPLSGPPSTVVRPPAAPSPATP